jgi:RHS repeat-associated protein
LTVNEPLGKRTTYGYDAVGNRVVVTDTRGGVTTFTYDEKDLLVSTNDPLGHTVAYGYDVVDNQTMITDALGHATTYGYDALNRRTVITDPLGHATTYAYDANGNRTSITDANGNVTTYTYDALNQLATVTDAEGGTVTYSYDANGNRTTMTDANGHVTAYAYDAMDRLLSVTDPLTHTIVYAYDAVGNRIVEQQPDGTFIQQQYDALDRLIAVDAPGLDIAYAYDALDNRTAITDTTGVTTYAYDDLYRLTQVTAPTGTLQYAYDLNGNRTHLTYPDGSVVTYTHDLADRLTHVIDWAGRTITYTYDVANRQTGIAYPNGTQATYVYDDADRLLDLQHTSTVSGTIAVFSYALDAVGNRLAMTDTFGVTSYAYDNLYRLTYVAYPDGEQVAYAYDPMGNRTALTSTVSGVLTYTYDAADRLLAAGSDTFGWDANGRMITRTYGASTATYDYDSLNRMTQVVSGTTNVAFTYNGDGVRMAKSVNGTATEYVQDIAADLPVVLQEMTGVNSDTYIYGNDLTTRFDASGDPAYYHLDGLGSVRALSNESGQHTDTYQYAAFGGVRDHSGSTTQPFQFTGEQADPSVGLTYLRARYYDPQLGRFISPDFFPGFAMDPQSANPYPYAQNNPVIYSDPNGDFVITALAIGAVGYATYKMIDAWSDALRNTEQMEENLSGYYEFDLGDPEWQERYADYNPGRDVAITARSFGYAALSTPGTSLTGQPPTSLDWTVPTDLLIGKFLLPGFEKPSLNRLQPVSINVYRRDSTLSSGRGHTWGGYAQGYNNVWGLPPSEQK